MGHDLEDDHYIGDLWHHTHEKDDVWVSQDTLHNDFVVDFCEQIICKSWVKDFLDCYWSSIEEAFVDDRKATLRNLLSNFNVI